MLNAKRKTQEAGVKPMRMAYCDRTSTCAARVIYSPFSVWHEPLSPLALNPHSFVGYHTGVP
jgi:hypothetical protein